MTQETLKFNAQVSVKELENIKGGKLKYVKITTPRGEVPISIGEKNYDELQKILKPRETSTIVQVLPGIDNADATTEEWAKANLSEAEYETWRSMLMAETNK